MIMKMLIVRGVYIMTVNIFGLKDYVNSEIDNGWSLFILLKTSATTDALFSSLSKLLLT